MNDSSPETLGQIFGPGGSGRTSGNRHRSLWIYGAFDFRFPGCGFQDEREFAAFDIVKLRAPELSGQSVQGLWGSV